MKNIIVFIAVIIFLSACNTTGKQLKEKITNADSVAINYFKGDGTMDTVVGVKIIRDKNTLEQLTSLITASSTAMKNNCGYDGSIHYFKMNRVIQDIDFTMNEDGCSLFSFLLNGKKEATKLPADAARFLNTQRKLATTASPEIGK